MKILFVHQNFPGQYAHLATHFGRSGHTVVALSSRRGVKFEGVNVVNYALPAERASGTHRYLTKFEEAVMRGERVAALALKLRRSGFEPDVICAHPGWGEALYLRDVWRDVPQLHYCEFFFAPFEGPSQFRTREPTHLDDVFAMRTRNTVTLLALQAGDAGVTPTQWQHRQFPSVHQSRISIVHDGVNANLVRPNRDAFVTLPDGRRLSTNDQVLTYVSRNLEPARGFPEFMRAAEVLLRRNPNLQILVVGGDEVSYGRPLPDGKTWRETMLAELELDRSRIHFMGKVPYATHVNILQISSVHVYLTVPFVLSWSMIEAMSAGCLLVCSNTEPVLEVIRDGQNGLLVDFFDRDALVRRIEEALRAGPALFAVREAARRTVLERYSLEKCLPEQIQLIQRVATMGKNVMATQ